MEDLAKAVESADSLYPVIAIAIIGIYVLAWRFGGQLLAIARENNVIAKEARSEALSISESIMTNHGSKSLGDAVDRLSEWMLQHMEESRLGEAELQKLRADFLLHVAQTGTTMSEMKALLAQFDSRLTKIEVKKEP